MRNWLMVALMAGGLAGLAGLTGCGAAKLETGYEPAPLTASSAERKNYYTEPFARPRAERGTQEH